MSERDEFEVWAKGRFYLDRIGGESEQADEYAEDATHAAWAAWQGARATPDTRTDDQLLDVAIDLGIVRRDYGGYFVNPLSVEEVLSVFRSLRSMPGAEAEAMEEACWKALMALAHASQRHPEYNDAYEAISAVLANKEPK